MDSGGAGFNKSSFGESSTSSLGIGLRLVFPKIHRLILRLDIAMNLRTQEAGLSAGNNQLFQPYKPL